MRKTQLLSFFCAVAMFAHAQTDTLFWFAAPEVSIHGSNFDRPIFLRILTYGQAAQVTISQPAGTMPVQVVNIPAGSVQTVDLTPWIDIIENKPPDAVLNYGLLIESTELITIYYEVASHQCQCNPELFVLKGQNAVGTDFFIPSQTYLNNEPTYSPQPFSSFDIVATENNTTITITPTNAVVGHAAGVPYNITLNRGQTYSATAASHLAAQHLQGSRVISTKPIAITVKDDLMNGAPFGGCADLGGDQIIPVPILGTEYIAMKGFLNGPGDQLFITATQNGTTISKDGVLLTTINSGQTYQVAVGGASTYIQTSAPAYVWQLSGFGCEVGLDVLPTIECTGSFSVGLSRTTNESLFMNVLVKDGGQGGFTVNGSTTVITPGLFSAVPGTNNEWYVAQISLPAGQYPAATPIIVNNPTSLFHLGVVHGSAGGGTRFGYFSSYAKFEVNANAQAENVCIGDAIQFYADSIPFATYNWTGPNNFSSALEDPVLPNATPANSGMYVALASVFGCDSDLDTVLVQVHELDTSTTTVTICPNTTYILPDGNVVSATGVYTSQLTSRFGCDSTVITDLTVATTNVNAGTDAAICNGGSTQLNATGGLIYSWSPTTGLSDPNIPNPVASPVSTTSYVVSSQVLVGGNNMLNGDFSAGNTGFTSSYLYTVNNNNEGQYLVGTNASQWNGGMASCGDHTSGTGNMLLVNGATTPNVTIYCQTVQVTPNTDYAFSTWLMTLTAGNPAQLQFSINGTLVGSVFTANNSTCIWEQFYTIWNSGNNTTASICVVNQNTIASANDFALDDMSFSQLCTATDTVVVSMNPPVLATVDTSFCDGSSFVLPGGDAVTVPGTYRDSLVASTGCDSIITTNLSLKVIDAMVVPTDALCNGDSSGTLAASGTGGTAPYSYSLSGTGNNTTGAFTGLAATTYTLTVTDASGCEVERTVVVAEPAALSNSHYVVHISCFGQTDGQAVITSLGGVAPFSYLLNGITNATGTFGALQSGNHLCIVTDANGCVDSVRFSIAEPDSIVLNVTPDTSIYLGTQLQLQAFTNDSFNSSYVWSPSTGLSCTACSNPVVSTYNTITYSVQATVSSAGGDCVAQENVVVTVIPEYGVFIPNAFTPNGDGENDYFEIYGRLENILSLEAKIFDRTGEKVFEATDISFKWDGTFKSKVVRPGVFVYVIEAVFLDSHKEFYKGSLTVIR